ncbi:MAG: tetratricopeptide repeat protein [Lachnospiraceae bacterium]|nr:tetratricopeptide repeat protein [Lachnospiraceae bacterium]
MYYLNEISALRRDFYKFYDKNSYPEAIEKGEKIISLYRENKDTTSVDYAQDLYNLAVIYDFLMMYDKALKLYRESVEVRDKLEIDDSEEYADAVNNMAVCLGCLNREAEALSLHKKALAIREKDLGRNHIDCIESLLNIGNTYDDMDRLDKALDFLTKALSRADRQKELPRIEYSDILCSLARVYAKKGSLTKAIIHYSRAIDIIEKEMGTDSAYFGKILGAAAKVCTDAEKYDMAIIYYEKAVEISKKLIESNSVEHIAELNLLGMAYAKNKNLEKAVEVFDNTLRIISELMDKDHVFYSDVLMNKSFAYYVNGDMETCSKILEMAYGMKVKNLGEDNIGLTNVLSKLITVNIKLKDYLKAETYCERLLEVTRKNDSETNFIANAYRNFAKLYIAKGNYIEAENYLLRAEAIYEEDAAEKKRTSYSRIISILSEVCVLNGDYERAEKYAGKVLAFTAEKYGQEHPHYAYALYKLAEKMILNNQFTAGIANLEKAMSICKDVMGVENEGYRQADKLLKATYGAAAFFYMETGDIKSASRNYEKAKDYLIDDERAIDFAGVYLSMGDINGAKEIMDKFASSDKYSLYNSWIRLKCGDAEASDELVNYSGMYASGINYDLAECFEKNGEHLKAVSYYEKALKGVDGERYIKAAAAVYSSEDRENIDELEKAISYADGRKLDKCEEYIYLINAVCLVYYRNGEYEKACSLYEKLILLVSDDAGRIGIHIAALTNIGRICSFLGKNDDAAEYLREAALVIGNEYGKNSAYSQRMAEAGDVYSKVSRYDIAKDMYSKALDGVIKNSEENVKLLVKLGNTHYMDNDEEKAFDIYEETYNMCIENGINGYFEGDWFLRLKEHYKANKKLDKLFRIKLGKTL